MMFIQKPLVVLLLGLLVMPTVLPAQEIQTTLPAVNVREKPDHGYQTKSNSGATKTETPILETPQSVQVISASLIQDQAAMNLQDSLRNVAGIQADFGFNGSGLPLYILRGFPAVSMTAQSPMSGSASYYLNGTKVAGIPVNMANVYAIEVIKGPASVMYGRAEPGGLVNVITKPISTVPEFVFEQTIGQYGLSRTLVEASGALNEDRSIRARASASYYSTHSIRDFVQDKLGAINAGLAWVPNSQSELIFSFDFMDQKYRNDYGIPTIGNRPASLPRERQFNDSPNLSTSKTTSLKLEASHQFSDAWKLKAKVLTVSSDTSEVDVAPYRVDLGMAMTSTATCPGTGNPLCRYYFNARPDGRYRLDQVSADLTGRIKTGSIEHTLLFGFDSHQNRKEGLMYLQQVDAVDINNPAPGRSPALDKTMSMSVDMQERDRWTSLYVQDQLGLGNGFFLTGALRYDKTSAIYAAPGTEPNKDAFTTPRIGAVWKFAANQSVYVQYQEAVSANNGRDPGSLKALAAEKSRQFEIGHKIEAFNGGLTSTVAIYELVKRNRADYSLFPLIQTIGEARSRGIEWDVAGQITRQLSVIGAYAYTDAVVSKDPVNQGKELANVARHTASVWARYAIDSQWTAAGGIFVQGQRQGDVGNTFQLPGYGRMDLMASYRFPLGGAKATLQFNIDNVLNKLYYTSSHQFLSDWIALGSPRLAKATLRLEY